MEHIIFGRCKKCIHLQEQDNQEPQCAAMKVPIRCVYGCEEIRQTKTEEE